MEQGRNSARYEQASRLIHQAVEIMLETSSEEETVSVSVSSSASTAAATSFARQLPITSTATHPPLQVEGAASSYAPQQQPGISAETNVAAVRSFSPYFASMRRTSSQELRDAFAPYSRSVNNLGRGMGRGRASSSFNRSRSRGSSPFPTSSSNTWSHKFCLIPYKDQVFVPSLSEKENWKLSGLGEKIVTFRKNGDHRHIEETLCTAYSQLKDAGGFLLLRSGSRSKSGDGTKLELIQIPYGGYSISYLKFDSPLRSATCYVRPMQHDLSLKELSSTFGESSADGVRVGNAFYYFLLLIDQLEND